MSAAAVTGWYGPMIDLSSAAFHVDDFVQLLVLVRRCCAVPSQKLKTSNGRAMHKTLFQVGDNTRAYFCLSIANKYLASIIHVGDIVLLQNVKLANYGEVIEAVATHISSVQVLLHSSQLVAKTGINELLAHCQVGQTTIEKLRKVAEWAQHTESVLQNVEEVYFQKREQSTKNWKSQEETDLRNCMSVSEVLHLTETCKASFLACISEIVLQSKGSDKAVESKLLPGKRLLEKVDAGRMAEIICTGCKICGCPVDSRYALEEMKFPLYCQKSTMFTAYVLYTGPSCCMYGTIQNMLLFLSRTKLQNCFLEISPQRMFINVIRQHQWMTSVNVIPRVLISLLVKKLLEASS